ncbi:MAG: c-type cytochrome [Terracidiphilus sp.]
MKITSLSPLTTLALSAMVVLAVATAAQTPQHPASGGGGHPPRTYPAPKNLKVLPKDTTGQQIHEIMEGWAGSLGVHCDTCHTADPKNVGPDGRPRLKFEDDSKDEKQMARIMYTMTEDIKKNYVKKVADMDKMDTPAAPLTCGTCHRGHLDPEKFVIPKEGGHGGPPPAGAMPPMQH